MNFFKNNAIVGGIFRMIIKKAGYIFLLLMVIPLSLAAQDATFSQYYASSLYLNPAFAGVESKITLATNYRNQWKSINATYITSQASLIIPIKTQKGDGRQLGGVGFSVYNNKAGEGSLETTGANLNLAYNVSVSSLHYLTFAARGGFIQKKISTDRFQWGAQYDKTLGDYDPSRPVDIGLVNTSAAFSDFGGGVMYYFNPQRDYEENGFSFYLGAAAYHLNRPNESLLKGTTTKLPMLYKSHIGCEWNLSPKFNFSPNLLFQLQQGQKQINTGAYATYLLAGRKGFTPGFVILGTWYRFKDSFIFSTGVGNSNYTIGFSYDLNKSSLRYNAGGTGAYEISLKIQIGTTVKKVRIYNPLI